MFTFGGGIFDSGCGEFCRAMEKLDNALVEVRNNDASLHYLLDFLHLMEDTDKHFVDEREGAFGHNMRNLNDLYYDLQKLLISSLSFSTHESNGIMVLYNNQYFELKEHQRLLFLLNKAFPCSRNMYITDKVTRKSWAIYESFKTNSLETTALLQFFHVRLNVISSVKNAMDFIGIYGCTFGKNKNFEGKCNLQNDIDMAPTNEPVENS